MLPRDCVLCGSPAGNSPLCAPCRRALPWLSAERCPICAAPSAGKAVCGTCLAEQPVFQHSCAALLYEFPVDALIQAFKYRGDLPLGDTLGTLLQDALAVEPRPDAIIPMPLHPARLRERGFNQALELARRVGQALQLPVLVRACVRVRDTPPQASLPWKERSSNIRGAFACEADLAGKRVAIVDDVMTTGHTLNELAAALKRAGAAEVYCWVVARAVKRS
ncbi:MAG TPA: ComF family protein [Burkholderiales bacterium]|nr:ComF family protein [Burkholderiales bacterium]